MTKRVKALRKVSPTLWRSQSGDLLVMRVPLGKGWEAHWKNWHGSKLQKKFATLAEAKQWYRDSQLVYHP